MAKKNIVGWLVWHEKENGVEPYEPGVMTVLNGEDFMVIGVKSVLFYVVSTHVFLGLKDGLAYPVYAVDNGVDSGGGTCRASCVDIGEGLSAFSVKAWRQFIKTGADVKFSALWLAVVKQRADLAQLVVKSGKFDEADINGAFRCAVYNDDVATAKILLSFGADVNCSSGMAIKTAARNNNVKMVRLLIKYGVDVNADQGLPLYFAETYRLKNMARILKKAGAYNGWLKVHDDDWKRGCGY